jgi:hypothetical protein
MRQVKLCLLLIGCWSVLSGCTGEPPGNPATLVDIGSVEELRRDFNSRSDVPRMILLMSPT